MTLSEMGWYGAVCHQGPRILSPEWLSLPPKGDSLSALGIPSPSIRTA